LCVGWADTCGDVACGVSSMRQEATPTMDDLFTQRHLLILLLMLLVIFGGPKLKALLVYLRIM
jgi:hypothetical protein